MKFGGCFVLNAQVTSAQSYGNLAKIKTADDIRDLNLQTKQVLILLLIAFTSVVFSCSLPFTVKYRGKG